MIYMISRDEILMGREKEYPLTEEMLSNLSTLLVRMNKLRLLYGKMMLVSSGYRPGHYNVDAGGAKNSCHLDCRAVDIHDRDGLLKEWILNHEEVLDECDLWMEDPKRTKTWAHFDIKAREHRIFLV